MKTHVKMTAFILLAALMLAAASCGGSEPKPAETVENPAQTAAGAAAAAETAAKETSLIDTLPSDLDFNGYGFHVLSHKITNEMYGIYLMPDGEENGDLLNDAAYRRNREVEERYNVKISLTQFEDPVEALSKSVMAGADEYQYFFGFSSWGNTLSLIQTKALVNLREMPGLDLDSEAFYSIMNDGLEVNGRLYYGFSTYGNAGDLPLYVVFNKNLIEDLGLEVPYDSISGGKWTWDVFLGYMKDSYADLNGNGQRDKYDRCGYVNISALANYLVWGFDIHNLKHDDRGGYVPDLLNEKFVNAMQRIAEFKFADDGVIAEKDRAKVQIEDRHIFLEGNALFTSSGTGILDPHLRFIEDFDFGIAPFPKYDEMQSEYISYRYPHRFMIPVTVAEPETVSAIVTGLAVTTREIMTPVKLDVYVQEKLLRDEGSQQVALMMMDISMVDVTYYFNFATGDVNPTELLEKITGADTVVSTLTKSQEVAMVKAGDFFDIFFE